MACYNAVLVALGAVLVLDYGDASTTPTPTTPAPPTLGDWTLYYPGPGNFTCLKLLGKIHVNLKYTTAKGERESMYSIQVPTTSTVLNPYSCTPNGPLQLQIPFKGQALVLSLNFVKNGTKFVMNAVNLTADFSKISNMTDIAQPAQQNFGQLCNLVGAAQNSLVCKTGYECGAGQKLDVKFTMMKIQAFLPTNATDFSSATICSGDIPVTDWIPIAIGGVLALIVIATLVIYLVFFNNSHRHIQQLRDKERSMEEKSAAIPHTNGHANAENSAEKF